MQVQKIHRGFSFVYNKILVLIELQYSNETKKVNHEKSTNSIRIVITSNGYYFSIIM